jgi:hypothetical protein
MSLQKSDVTLLSSKVQTNTANLQISNCQQGTGTYYTISKASSLYHRQMPLRQSQQSHSEKLSVKLTLQLHGILLSRLSEQHCLPISGGSDFQFHWGISYHTAVSPSKQVRGWYTDCFLPNPWHLLRCSITSASLLHASTLHTHNWTHREAFVKTVMKLCGA